LFQLSILRQYSNRKSGNPFPLSSSSGEAEKLIHIKECINLELL
jgi:hypothetical protein